MCVAAIAWAAHPDWALVAIGNRDEFHDRPADPLARWDEAGIIAGRDRQAGGTWLGVSPGRFALVTNHRAEGYPRRELASRGALVSDWLRGHAPTDTAAMNPFNLWLADPQQLMFVTNHPAPGGLALAAGIHGLSNGPRRDRWFKTRRLETALADWLDAGASVDTLLDQLNDSAPDPDDPGNALSAVFIRSATYGTRCSSVVAIDRVGNGIMIERSFSPAGLPLATRRVDFDWNP